MKIKTLISLVLLFLFTASLLCGCASQSKDILKEDYKALSNVKLLEYFYRLNDEIEKQEKQKGPSFGIGIGGFGRHTFWRRCWC